MKKSIQIQIQNPRRGDVNDELGGEQQTVIVGEKPNTIDVNQKTDNKLDVIEIAPQQQVIDDSVQSEIVDLSGKIIIDGNTGNAYNIDEVDVSQFTEMFIVSCNDDPLQNYEKITLQLLDDEIKKESDDNQKAVLEEIQVQQKHNVTNPDVTEEKDDDVPEGDVGKSSLTHEDIECEKHEEKRDAVEENKDWKTEGKLDAVEPEEKPDVTEEKDDDVPDEVIARIEGDVGKSSLTHEDTECEKHEEKRDAVEENKDRKTEGKLDAVEPEEKPDVTKEKDDDVPDEVIARIEGDVGKSSLTHEDTEREKTEEKCDVSVSEEATVNEKHDVTVTEEKSEVPEEKHDVTEAAENDIMKHDDSCSSRSERIINTNKNDSSDVYNSETEDTTDSSSHENDITISKKSSHSDNADVIPEVKHDRKSIELIDLVSTSSSEENKKIQCDVEIDSDVQEMKQTTEKRDVKCVLDVDDEKHERPDSPDNSMITMSRKRCAIVDTVPRRREETRSQYRCNLARKFITRKPVGFMQSCCFVFVGILSTYK